MPGAASAYRPNLQRIMPLTSQLNLIYNIAVIGAKRGLSLAGLGISSRVQVLEYEVATRIYCLRVDKETKGQI